MMTYSQKIQVSRGGDIRDATIDWRQEGAELVVTLAVPAFDPVERRASDAFEALCRVREAVEPEGWRIGVAGAQRDVWPSGMARDQGRGLRAYRMRDGRAEGMVGTFDPVDPATVVTVAEQHAAADRLYETD